MPEQDQRTFLAFRLERRDDVLRELMEVVDRRLVPAVLAARVLDRQDVRDATEVG